MYGVVFVLFCIHLILPQFRSENASNESARRILSGKEPRSQRSYVVYLVQTNEASPRYDTWLCGGAIIHREYILTSAACIEDAKYMYAIAGYRKYVTGLGLYNDRCTKHVKKKVTFTCVPEPYELDYDKVEKWAKADIGIVGVERPYDFTDEVYLDRGCNYVPSKIEINFSKKCQRPGIKGKIYGWGHIKKFRKPKDHSDLNAECLLEADVSLVENQICKSSWMTNVNKIIDRYMICSDNDQPVIHKHRTSRRRECVRRRNMITDDFDATLNPKSADYHIRRSNSSSLVNNTRRGGFCQNDHGGPLVTTVNGREVLLGVQSAFLVDPDYNCRGPYLYTSTYCNMKFIKCILKHSPEQDCGEENAERNGFRLIERRISWIGHPDGPAANELSESRQQFDSHENTKEIKIRPQISLN